MTLAVVSQKSMVFYAKGPYDWLQWAYCITISPYHMLNYSIWKRILPNLDKKKNKLQM
jgi:hypothetical protein